MKHDVYSTVAMKSNSPMGVAILAAILLMGLGDAAAQSTGLSGYTYSTGVTSGLTQTATTVMFTGANSDDINYDDITSQMFDIGFAFPFGGEEYTRFSVNSSGLLRLGNTTSNNCCTDFTGDDGAPRISGFLCDGFAKADTYAKTVLLGDTLRVVEFRLATYSDWRDNSRNRMWKHQIHLYKSGRVRIIQMTDANYVPNPDWQVGMSIDNTDGWVVKPDYTAVHFTNSGEAGEYFTGLENSGTVKFVANRWFLFTPPSETLYAVRPPSGVRAASFTSTGFTLSWVGQASADKYVIRYDDNEVSTASTSYAITGLTPQRALTVQVATVVGTDTSSFAPLYVQMPYSLPYVQNFDSYAGEVYSAMPAGWWNSMNYYEDYYGYSNLLNDGSYSQDPYVWLDNYVQGWKVCWSCDVEPTTLPGSAAHLSISNQYDKSYNRLHARAIAATPPFDVDANKLRISFKYMVEAHDNNGTESYTNIYLRVGLIKDLNSEEAMCGTAATSWVTIGSYRTLKAWQTVTGLTYATSVPAGTYRLAFYWENLNDAEDLSVYIDDIQIENRDCTTPDTKPTDLYATNLTSSGFRLNWSSTADASTPYTVFLDDEVAGTTAAGIKYFDVTGLEPLSTHRLQVRAGSACPSLPSDIMYIRTACSGGIDAPYSENFDDYTGAGVAGGTVAPNVSPNHILPGCWTFNGLDTWSTSSYKFSTGIDAGKWIATTSNKSLTYSAGNGGDGIVSGLKTMTFSFPFGGSTYTQFSFNEDGQIRLGEDEIGGNVSIGNPLSSGGANSNNPKIVGCGMDGQKTSNNTNTYGAWANYSDTVTVVQYRISPYGYIAADPGVVYLPYQVQLYKSGRILMAYQTMSGTAWSPSFQVGFGTDASNVWTVSSNGLSTSFHGNGSSDYLDAWPANGRWYEWKPSTASYPQAFITSGVANGGNSLMLVNGRAEDVQHVVLPLVEGGDLSHLAFNFSYRQSTTASTVGELAIGTMSDPDDPSTFVLLRALDRTTSWVTIRDTIGIHDPAPSQRYLAFRYTGGTTVGENTAIDNVSVTKVKCLPPSDLTVSNITSTSMRLSWTDHNEGASSYVIDLNGTEYVVAAGTNYRDFTGLKRGQACKFTVKADCGGDGKSDARILYANALCDDGVDLPYVENFDYYGPRISNGTTVPADYPAGHTLPNCWTFTGMSASGSTYPQAFITDYSTWRVAGNGLLFKSNTSEPITAALPLPADGVPTAQLHLHFQYKQSDLTSYTGTLLYGLMTDPDDASTFVLLDTLTRSTAWATVDCDIAAHPVFKAAFTSSSRPHIAFKYIGGSSTGYYTAIDDVRLTPLCLADLGASTTSTTCRLHWTDVSGGAYAFDIYEGETRLGGVAAGTTQYDITSLTPGSVHTYRVQAVCGGCSCEPVSITVPIPCAGSLPYAEYFDSYGSSSAYISANTTVPSHYNTQEHYLPTCWQFPGMSTNSAYYPHAFLSTSSNPSVRVSTPCGLFLRIDRQSAPMVAVINQDFGVPMQRIQLSYQYLVYNNASADAPRLEWGVVTDVTNPSTFVPLGGGSSGTFVPVVDTVGNYSLPSGNLYLAFRLTKVAGGSGVHYAAIDNVDLTLLPDCNIYGLTAVNVIHNTATLSWENPTGTSYTYTVKNGDDVLASGITDTFYTVSGLTPGTEYTLTVLPSCGGSGRSITFSTDCDAIAYCDDFESYTAQTNSTSAANATFPNQRPACWRFPGHSTTYNTYPYAVVSSSADCRSAGSKGMLFKCYGPAAPAVAVLPPVYSTPVAYMKLKLSYKYYNASYGELSYGVMSNPYDTNTFIKIGTFPRVNTAWHTDSVYIGRHGSLISSDYKRIVLRFSATSNSYWAAIDNLCLEAQACPPVGGLTLNSINGASVDFSWVDHSGGTASYHFLVNGVEWHTTAAGATSATLTGLPRGSVHTIGVYADCGGGSHGDTVETQVLILCDGEVDFPYIETFDRYNPNAVNTSDVISSSTGTTYTTPSAYPAGHTRPDCWTFLGLSPSTGTYPQIFIAKNLNYNRDGDTVGHRGLMFKTSGTTTKRQCYAVLPLANGGDLTRARLSFDYKQSTANADEGVLSYGVVTDPNDSTTYVNIATLAKVTAWTHIDADISQAVGIPVDQPLYVAFRYGSAGTGTGTTTVYTGLDNVQLTLNADACQAPGLGVTDNSSGTSVTLGWYDNNAGGCTYTVFKDGVEVATTAAGATSYTFSGLTAYTDYLFRVRANCSGDPYSEMTVRTTCAAGIALPYLEDFEGYTDGRPGVDYAWTANAQPTVSTYPGHLLPNCWTFSGIYPVLPDVGTGKLPTASGSYPNAYLTRNDSYSRGGSGVGKSLLFRTGYTGKSVYAALPLVNGGDLTRVLLSFRYIQSSTTVNVGELSYGVMTDPADTGSYVKIKTLAKTTAWTEVTDTLSMHVLPSGPLYVAFRYGGKYYTTVQYTALDSVAMREVPGCLRPGGLTTTLDVAAGKAVLSWVDHNSDPSPSYSSTQNDSPLHDPTTSLTSDEVTGLVAGTLYTFKVIPSCDAEKYSTVTVQLPCDASGTLPYRENFDTYNTSHGISTSTGVPTTTGYRYVDGANVMPDCWQFPNINRASTSSYPQAFLTSSGAYSGRTLLLSSNYASLPIVASVAKDFGVPARKLGVFFKYKVSTASYTPRLEWGVTTNPADVSSFIPLGENPRTGTGWVDVSANLGDYPSLPANVPVYLAFRQSGGRSGYSTAYFGYIENVKICDVTTTPTVAVASDSYTWTSGDGSTYTETGEYYYRHVVDSCPLVDTLRLTISSGCTPSVHVVPEVWPNSSYGSVTLRVVSSGTEYTDDPSALYCEGDTLELTAAPRNALRSKFLMWGLPPFGGSTVRFVVPAGDTNVTAFFGPMKEWHDSVSNMAAGGAVDYDEYYYTARPVGASYVTTHEGDVHIYDERGLAWLMSVANGLNGVQSRQFYYNRVYLHKKSDGKPYDMRGGQWVPLGSVREPFRGWFIGTSSSATDTARLAQGDRVVVRHLTVSTDADVAGFFGAVDTARISGLQLDSCFVRGGRFTGGLVGTAKDARIVNCAVTGAVGSVLVGRYASGGMAGEADGTLIDGVVTDAAYLGAVVYSGGAVGHGTSVVVRNSSLSYGNGGWPMEGLYAGGVAGWLDGVAPVVSSISPMAKAGASVSSLRNNYVRVKAYGSQYIGGLAGYASASEMENNYVWGTVQATAVGGVAAILDGRSRADRNYYERGSMSAAVVRARGGSDTGESADFSGTGNAVSLGHQVAGSTNLTQALNFWVRDNAGEGYFSWRSDLEGMNGGYPLFGEPDLIPVAATLTVEGCDSALYAGQWYRTGDQLTEHTLDSLLLTDTVLTVHFAVHPTARTTHRDTAQIGMVYRGYGFTLSANAAMLLRTTVDSLGSVTVSLRDTLQSVHGCDSVVTLMLTLQPKEGTLGIGDAGRQPQVVVRPNPATRLTTVEADAILWVELYDGAGRRLHRTAYDGVASATVDLEGLSSGVYLLRVGTPSGVVVEKVSKK